MLKIIVKLKTNKKILIHNLFVDKVRYIHVDDLYSIYTRQNLEMSPRIWIKTELFTILLCLGVRHCGHSCGMIRITGF